MNSNKCTILYGMSGSLKLTTINFLYKEEFKVYSDTKPFFNYDKLYFNWSGVPNDSHLAIHRLLTLDLEGYLPNDRNIVIERGVSDNIFCVPNRKLPGLDTYDKIKIKELVDKESEIISRKSGARIEKILLIMEDKKFIENEVLKEDSRRSIYPDLNIYLSKQDEYIEFTNKWNSISKTIIIRNAFDYINKLKDYECNSEINCSYSSLQY